MCFVQWPSPSLRCPQSLLAPPLPRPKAWASTIPAPIPWASRPFCVKNVLAGHCVVLVESRVRIGPVPGSWLWWASETLCRGLWERPDGRMEAAHFHVASRHLLPAGPDAGMCYQTLRGHSCAPQASVWEQPQWGAADKVAFQNSLSSRSWSDWKNVCFQLGSVALGHCHHRKHEGCARGRL